MALGILKLKSRQVYGDCVHLLLYSNVLFSFSVFQFCVKPRRLIWLESKEEFPILKKRSEMATYDIHAIEL